VTTATVELIPPEWAAALEAAPGCFATRLALVDWLLERDRAAEADCWYWTVQKRRSPVTMRDSLRGWAWPQHLSSEFPPSLFHRMRTRAWEDTVADAFTRLLSVWVEADDEDRGLWWNWIALEEPK
jgi:hypothetical protein